MKRGYQLLVHSKAGLCQTWQPRGFEVYHTWRQNTSYVSGLTATVQICINCDQPRLQENPLSTYLLMEVIAEFHACKSIDGFVWLLIATLLVPAMIDSASVAKTYTREQVDRAFFNADDNISFNDKNKMKVDVKSMKESGMTKKRSRLSNNMRDFITH